MQIRNKKRIRPRPVGIKSLPIHSRSGFLNCKHSAADCQFDGPVKLLKTFYVREHKFHSSSANLIFFFPIIATTYNNI